MPSATRGTKITSSSCVASISVQSGVSVSVVAFTCGSARLPDNTPESSALTPAASPKCPANILVLLPFPPPINTGVQPAAQHDKQRHQYDKAHLILLTIGL